VRMHADQINIPWRKAGDIRGLFGVECARATPWPIGHGQLHDDVHALPTGHLLAVGSPHGQGGADQFSKALQPLHHGDPDFRVSRDESQDRHHSAAWGSCTWTSTSSAGNARTNCVVIPGRAQVSTARPLPAWRVQLHAQEANRVRAVRARCGLHRALPSDHEGGYELWTKSWRLDPREFIPACDKGFREAMKRGPLIASLSSVCAVSSTTASRTRWNRRLAFRTAA